MTYEEQMNDHIGFIERELEYSRQLHERNKLYLSNEWHEHKKTCIEYFSNLEKENEQLKAQIESMKETLEQIRWETNEHGTHNMAENELLKWGYIDG